MTINSVSEIRGSYVRLSEFFDRDRNRDGQLEPGEIDAADIRAYDTDENGSLSAVEIMIGDNHFTPDDIASMRRQNDREIAFINSYVLPHQETINGYIFPAQTEVRFNPRTAQIVYLVIPREVTIGEHAYAANSRIFFNANHRPIVDPQEILTVCLNLAQDYSRSGYHRSALDILTYALNHLPGNMTSSVENRTKLAELHSRLGQLYIRFGNYAQAGQNIERALRHFAGPPRLENGNLGAEIYAISARILQHRNELTRAFDHYEQAWNALSLTPDNSPAHREASGLLTDSLGPLLSRHGEYFSSAEGRIFIDSGNYGPLSLTPCVGGYLGATIIHSVTSFTLGYSRCTDRTVAVQNLRLSANRLQSELRFRFPWNSRGTSGTFSFGVSPNLLIAPYSYDAGSQRNSDTFYALNLPFNADLRFGRFRFWLQVGDLLRYGNIPLDAANNERDRQTRPTQLVPVGNNLDLPFITFVARALFFSSSSAGTMTGGLKINWDCFGGTVGGLFPHRGSTRSVNYTLIFDYNSPRWVLDPRIYIRGNATVEIGPPFEQSTFHGRAILGGDVTISRLLERQHSLELRFRVSHYNNWGDIFHSFSVVSNVFSLELQYTGLDLN